MSGLQHVGMLTFVDDATEEQVGAIVEGLSALPGVIPGLVGFTLMPDAGLQDGGRRLAFVADFESEDAWRAYGDHPAHQAVVVDLIRPILATKNFVQSRTADRVIAP